MHYRAQWKSAHQVWDEPILFNYEPIRTDFTARLFTYPIFKPMIHWKVSKNLHLTMLYFNGFESMYKNKKVRQRFFRILRFVRRIRRNWAFIGNVVLRSLGSRSRVSRCPDGIWLLEISGSISQGSPVDLQRRSLFRELLSGVPSEASIGAQVESSLGRLQKRNSCRRLQ